MNTHTSRRVELFHCLAGLRAKRLEARRLGGYYAESYTEGDRKHLEKVERLYRIHIALEKQTTR